MKKWLDDRDDTRGKYGAGYCFHCGRASYTARCTGDEARTCFLEIDYVTASYRDALRSAEECS